MDTSKAKQELGWRPQYTSARALAAMAAVVGDWEIQTASRSCAALNPARPRPAIVRACSAA